jgi:hypothetical protein
VDGPVLASNFAAMATDERPDKDRSAVLPEAGGKRPSSKPAPRPPAKKTSARPPALPTRLSISVSDAPPRLSRLSFSEWFRNSVPVVRRPIKRLVPHVRKSLLPIEDFVRATIVPWVPRWRGWSAARTLSVTFGFGAFMLLLVLLTPHSIKSSVYRRAAWLVSPLRSTAEGPDVSPDFSDDGRADGKLLREDRSPVLGGVFSIPPSFSSPDGKYDLVLHFHGNTELVEDSFAVAKINAVIVIENLGIGSGAYEDRFSNADVFRDTLARVDEALTRRHLRTPKLRRIALSAWSAGYGAVVRIIENPAFADQVDSVLLMDGIHASYLQDGSIDPLRMGPYERFARRAIANEKLFVITHSEIKPPDYPGTHATTDALLEVVGIAREPGGETPEFPPLSSLHGVPKSKIVALQPLSQAHEGSFHVHGYGGETADDHIAHLVQMAKTTLPYLVNRWQ